MKSEVLIKILVSIIILLIISNIASAKGKEISYMRDGISFSVPEDWKITANDSIGENAYYFSTERTGNKATGLITVTWINRIEKPEEIIAVHQRSMKSANIYRNPGIEFTAVNPDDFAGLKVLSCRYTTIVKEQKLDGIIYCFNASQKTITIFLQSGLNDKKINQKSFELFKLTFNCRE
jgi:hypothetical protein